MAFSYVLWALSRDFTVFVIARIVGGISKGNVSLSTAVVADVAPPEKRSKGMVNNNTCLRYFNVNTCFSTYFALIQVM